MTIQQFTKSTPDVKAFFDEKTNTVSYVVSDPVTKKAAVIDSVLDYEPHGATISYDSAEKIITYVNDNRLTVEWILETHVHADHITAAKYIKEKVGGKIAISKFIVPLQEMFGKAFNEDSLFKRDGSQFDVLFDVDQEFTIGELKARALYVPGHTPADVAYVIGNSVFVGDTIFMPDMGSARCDFPGGDANALYESVQKLLSLPSDTKMYMCHDYLPEGRFDYIWQSTVKDQKENNIHLASTISQEEFTERRKRRDSELGMPRLIIPSIQINLRGGELPRNPEGEIFLTIPVNGVFSKK